MTCLIMARSDQRARPAPTACPARGAFDPPQDRKGRGPPEPNGASVPVSGVEMQELRSRALIASMVGHCSRTIPLDAAMACDGAFREFADETKAAFPAKFRHAARPVVG